MRIKVMILATTMSLMPSLVVTANASDNMAGYSPTESTASAIVSEHYSVELNKTKVVYLPEPAAAVVIGNPSIADVSVHSSDTVFIVGRGFGETNLIVLNSDGRTILNSNVEVTSTDSPNNVRIFGGSAALRRTYNCAPYCQPAPMLGDVKSHVSANQSQGREIINTYAAGSSIVSAPPPTYPGE